MTLAEILTFLKDYDGPPMTIMEVCGSHTAAIHKEGIPGLLSGKIRLISGPGCPVCVTPSAYIDKLIDLAMTDNMAVVTFGDLLRVPGSQRSLAEARGDGADVRMVYSPFDVVAMAQNEEDTTFVYAAVGFETTMPVYALLLNELIAKEIKNVRFLTSLKTMPEVIQRLLENGAPIDGFLAPGHVAVVTGSRLFKPLAEGFGLPFCVAGFKGEEIVTAVYDLLQNRGQGVVHNMYPSVVSEAGNETAQGLVDRYFEKGEALWRGLGLIEGSGRYLKKEYAAFDAGSFGLNDDISLNKACRCADVLMGRITSKDCPLFGKVCTPMTPQGACMVSQEGSCFAAFSVL